MKHADTPDGAAPLRSAPGLGLVGRITLWLGAGALVFAVPTTFLLLRVAASLQREAVEDARREMAATTARMRAAGAELPGELPAERVEHGGVDLQIARGEVSTSSGPREARIYRAVEPGAGSESAAEQPILLFAPAQDDPAASSRLLVLVLMVTGGLVVVTVALGAWVARRAVTPVQAMIEDVMAVSRGRIDHLVHVQSASGEVAQLGRAVDRMVRDLVAKEAAQRALAKSQRESELLRELRRNLLPMTVAAPSGYTIETRLLEAEDAGSGDFVDALADDRGRLTVVVGATAARGTPGALLMAMTRAYLRGAILQGQPLAAACDSTNASLNRDLARGLYASAVVARLEPESGQVELVSPGHKAPAIRYDAASGQLRKIQPNGIALGFDQGPVFRRSLETTGLQLKPGDALFLFSPDAFDCTSADGRPLGENGVYTLAKLAVQEGLASMEGKLHSFLGAPPRTDLAFALLRRESA
ncbi:MAG: HAMP domain-containing protein [Planctomycetota bacterium]|nr:MAG: HAMP domain-containing protein [Planctomycetota bacterium]